MPFGSYQGDIKKTDCKCNPLKFHVMEHTRDTTHEQANIDTARTTYLPPHLTAFYIIKLILRHGLLTKIRQTSTMLK